jgi:hypothetical protein
VLDSFYTSSNRILFEVAFTVGEKCSGYLLQFSIAERAGLSNCDMRRCVKTCYHMLLDSADRRQ